MSKHCGKMIVGALMPLLLCMGSVFAAATSPERAEKAAKGWVKKDRQHLGTKLAGKVMSTKTFTDVDGTVLYHVVRLAPAGFVVVAADDWCEPIIAFSAGGTYDQSPHDPMFALLVHDMKGRIRKAHVDYDNHLKAAKDAKAALLAPPSVAQTPAGKWLTLEGLADSGNNPLNSIADVRVAPLVQSQWNQSNFNGVACFNYYTPPGLPGSTSNFYCGCVATAMSQLMRFYQYPVGCVGNGSFSIGVEINGVGFDETDCLRGGDGAGGPYDWNDMVLVPDSTLTTTQAQAIGALTHDAGVAVGMYYTDYGSGAFINNATNALKNTFFYANAIYGGANGGADLGATLTTMLAPNLDAGFPVVFGIWNDGRSEGHCIVCDGYGYDSSTLYHHLNLGWSGEDDAWYNLPNIGTGYDFTAVTECIYNVYPAGSGEIISGRVTDANGKPLSGAQVNAWQTGGGNYSATTSSAGIFALAKIPSASTYNLSVSLPGYGFTNQTVSTGTSNNAAAGNVWGANFTANATQVSTPTFSLPPGGYSTAQSVAIACATTGATIYYTTNGSAPNTSLAQYSTQITIASTQTIRAYATKSGLADSGINSACYTIAPRAAAPTFSPTGGTYANPQVVTISSSTTGAAIYYTTDGATPSTASPLYATPISVSETMTVKACAVKTGLLASTIANAVYTLPPQVALPILNPPAGTYSDVQTVTIYCATSGATVYYTTDNSTPSKSSTLYSGPITVSGSVTIKACAVETGWTASAVNSAAYTLQVATPAFSRDGGTFSMPQQVTITCATSGAAIYYTTDGSTPGLASNLYSGAITISASGTLQAIAIQAPMSNSQITRYPFSIVYNTPLVAWGYNDCGQCNVPSNLSAVVAVAPGEFDTTALKNDGSVEVWGSVCAPPAGLNNVQALGAGYCNTVALKTAGTVVAWGDNSYGECNVPTGLSGVTALSGGYLHSAVLKSDGTVVAWGDDAYGESDVPSGLTGVTAVAAGWYHTLALKNDGTVVAWGTNARNECTVPNGLSNAIAISAGYCHSVALLVLCRQ